MPEVNISGPAGRIEARYHHNGAPNSPVALILHPHPKAGGQMNNPVAVQLFHLFMKRAWALAAAWGDATDAAWSARMMAGRDVSGLPPSLRNYGIVFQSYALFPNLTVGRNVAYGLETRRTPAGASP